MRTAKSINIYLGFRFVSQAGQKQSKKMGSQHYSLRWNNHQNHILNAFDTLLQSETLVDVTLVCEETSVRAHKVVLSACRYLI